jgi:pyruvate, water dikinase
MSSTRGSGDSPTQHTSRGSFQSPFEVPSPPGGEGWEEMYPYHLLFSADRRDFDEDRFWFQDSLHWPEPLRPFDAVVVECAVVALNQANARLFAVPPSLGVEFRLLNGYEYLSANSVIDEAGLGRRSELFAKRAGYYYEHWDELYASWREKVEDATGRLMRVEVPSLPEFEDAAVVTEGRGWGSTHALLVAFDRLLESLDRLWQYHFEFLNLGYSAYLGFCQLCRDAFPDITDQAIARMFSGIDVLNLRPDDELRRLAALALELGVADEVKTAADETQLRDALTGTESGARWAADFENTKDPWFYFSYGSGLYSHHRSWIDDTTLPIAIIGSYIERLERDESISRPGGELAAERERITAGYRSMLPDDERSDFDQRLALARMVFPFVEDHNFYIDHRYLTVFWNKVRAFGGLLSSHGFLPELDDIFYLRPDEVRLALDELRLHWSAGSVGPVRGPAHWPPIVARRKAKLAALQRWPAPPAVGQAPPEITDPMMIMLWGMTTERVRGWLSASDEHGLLTGVAASPGSVEGLARVILDPTQLGALEEGEILVAPSTSTSWTPLFGKAVAAISEVGGIMCHAAIVAREYGLPAVVGVSRATETIRTGDRLRVDGDAGTVTRLVPG